jgi:hypothetical protein
MPDDPLPKRRRWPRLNRHILGTAGILLAAVALLGLVVALSDYFEWKPPRP